MVNRANSGPTNERNRKGRQAPKGNGGCRISGKCFPLRRSLPRSAPSPSLIIIGGRPEILRGCPPRNCGSRFTAGEKNAPHKKTSTAPSQRLCSSCSDRTLLETDPVGRTAAVIGRSDRQPDPAARCQAAASPPASARGRCGDVRLDVLNERSGRRKGPCGLNGSPQFTFGYRMPPEVFKSSRTEGAGRLPQVPRRAWTRVCSKEGPVGTQFSSTESRPASFL